MSFKFRRGGYIENLRPPAAVKLTHHDVVGGAGITIPGYVAPACAIRCNGGRPVVGGRSRDALGGRPGRAIVAPGKNVRLAVSESLPDQPQIPVRVPGQVVVDVGLRIVRQPLDRRPRFAVMTAAV